MSGFDGFDIQLLQVNMAGGRIVTLFLPAKFTTYGDRLDRVSVVRTKFENKIVRLMELPWLNCNLVMV